MEHLDLNAAVIARAIRDALETGNCAYGVDFQIPDGYTSNVRRAVRMGTELAAIAIAQTLGYAARTDARKAFLTACGVNDPAIS